MFKLIADLLWLLFGIPLLLLGGMFKLLDAITGAVPGTPTQDRGGKLFLVLSILGYVVWWIVLFATEGISDSK
jgi:hypothetical protein